MAKDINSEAAKKVAEAEKASKKKTGSKGNKENVFARIGKTIAKFFKDLKGENKKIIWPNGKTVVKSTIVVIVCVLIVGAGIWLVDFGLSKGIDAVLGIKVGEETTAEAEAEDTAVPVEGEQVEAVAETEAQAEAQTEAQPEAETEAATESAPEKAETQAVEAEVTQAEATTAE